MDLQERESVLESVRVSKVCVTYYTSHMVLLALQLMLIMMINRPLVEKSTNKVLLFNNWCQIMVTAVSIGDCRWKVQLTKK